MEDFRIEFEKMTQEEYPPYRENSLKGYARDMGIAGVWDEDDLKRADAEFSRLLPDGIRTPGMELNTIKSKENGEKIGYIWFQIKDDKKKTAYVWDILIFENQRGKGYGKDAMLYLEDYCRKRGATQIMLNVFGHNRVAINLYEGIGFRPVAIGMKKEIQH